MAHVSNPAAGARPDQVRATGRGRALGVLLAAGTVGASGLAATVAFAEEPVREVAMAWWLLVVFAVAVELAPIDVRVAGDKVRIRLIELPAMLGVVLASLPALLLARLAATVTNLVVRRPRPADAVATVIADVTGFGVLVAVFAVLKDGHADSVRTLLAAVVAVAVAAAFLTGALGVALRQPQVLQSIVGRTRLAAANALVGAIGAAAFLTNPATAALFVAVAALLVYGYRSHAHLRGKHDDLGLLYEFTRRTGRALNLDSAMRDLLGQVGTALRARTVELVVRPSRDSAPLVRTRLSAEGVVQVTTAPQDGLWRRMATATEALLAAAPVQDPELAAELAAHGLRDGMVAPLLRSDDATIGILIVGNRDDEERTFTTDDLALFEALANHAGVALENRHLVDRLRMEAADKEHQALHDALTGLPNRILFHRRVTEALVEGMGNEGEHAAVLLLDLNRFKDVNDTLGHHNGDRLLEEVAERLRRSLRAGDTVARLGGDEFGVLLTELSGVDAAVAAAEGLHAVLERPFVTDGLTLDVGGSIGVAMWPEHGGDATTLLQRADVAMYAAKGQQGGIAVYDAATDTYSLERLTLVGDLRQAIEHGELAVRYQPKADARTGAVVGLEALVRWDHPRYGAVLPEEIVSVAEQTGLIRGLTQWVTTAALRDLRGWRLAGHDCSVAVNLSVRAMLDANLPTDVLAALDDFGVPSSALTFEVTESSILVEPVRSTAVLSRLRGMGVGLAIDDFGTGWSSFSQLRRLPVDEIKVDRSFVTAMTSDESDALIVRSIVDLGRNLGLRVVAEGVEDDATWKALEVLGCDVVQGFVLSEPIAADEVLAWLDAWRATPPRETPETGGDVVPFPTPASRPR